MLLREREHQHQHHETETEEVLILVLTTECCIHQKSSQEAVAVLGSVRRTITFIWQLAGNNEAT